jgi:hypothetical protein
MIRILFPVALAVSAALPVVLPQDKPDTFIVQVGDPKYDGTATLTVKIEYIDKDTKKQFVTLTVTLEPKKDWGPTRKREEIQKALKAKIAAAAVFGGGDLIETGGTGNALTMTPSRDGPVFSSVKINVVTPTDKQTNEKDVVVPPAPKNDNGSSGMATIELVGTISGVGTLVPLSASELSFSTNQGADAVALAPNMSNVDALEALRAKLVAQGAVAYMDADAVTPRLTVVFNAAVSRIGLGSSDSGIETVLAVMAQ